jgi:hypothetical protein
VTIKDFTSSTGREIGGDEVSEIASFALPINLSTAMINGGILLLEL